MDDARAGRTLAGRYRLIGKLGGGGAASVWRAEDLQTQAIVALKLLHPKYRAHMTVRDRLAREADLLSRFDHPNVARALGFGFEHVQPYFVMELIEGCSIQDELAERSVVDQHLEPEELGRVVLQLASAVEYAHGQGVVHRDLKPANIMLEEGPEGPTVKVLDFGIAKLLENTDPQIATTRGRVLGSGFYMAPEQALGQPVTGRCDIFALASVTLELLTLRRAWVRNDQGGFVVAFGEPARLNAHNQASELLRRLAKHPRPKASEMRVGLDERFDEIFEGGLAIDPNARPSSALAFAQSFIARLPAAWGGDVTQPTPLAHALSSRSAPVDEVSLIGVPTTLDLEREVSRTDGAWQRADTEARPDPGGVDPTGPSPAVDWFNSDAQVEPQPLDRNQSPSVVVTTAEQRTMIDTPLGAPQIVSPVAEPMPEDSWSRTPTGGLVQPAPVKARGSRGVRILVTVAAVLSLLVVGFFAGRVTGPTTEAPVPQVTLQPAAPAAEASPNAVRSAEVVPPEPAPEAAPEPAPEPVRAPPPTVARARTPSRDVTPPSPPATEEPKAAADVSALQARLRKLRAEPTDLEGVEALSAAIQQQAKKVSDPDARRRIRRIAVSSSMVGDLDGVARALSLLESSL